MQYSTDIFPDAVKIGMVSNAALIRVIAQKLKQYGAKHIVVDPVMVATSGSKLMQDEAVDTLKAELLPLAEVVTPNIPEAEILSGMEIRSAADMEKAAKFISENYACAVLLKGGHDLNDANDLLYRNGKAEWFYGKRIDNPQYPRHGLYALQRDCIGAGLRRGFEHGSEARQGLHLRRVGSHARPGQGQRADEPPL